MIKILIFINKHLLITVFSYRLNIVRANAYLHFLALTSVQAAILLVILLASSINSSFADSTTNLVIYDKNSHYQLAFLKHLQKQLKNHGVTINSLTIDHATATEIDAKKPSLIINLDKAFATSLVDYNIKTPVFHTLLTIADLTQLLPCAPLCETKKRKNQFFILDQPPSRQLALIKLIKPSAIEIGLIYTRQTATLFAAIQKFGDQTNLKINGFLTQPDSLGFMLNDIAKSSDIILALADTSIYSASTLPQILLTSYRHRTPVIGFSKGFITAGAVAGVTSNLEQLAQHLAEKILEKRANKPIMSNGIVFPKYFNILSNRRVAKSLNLHFPDDRVLTATIKSDELP
ncbi:MAG: ABC transporter substrate-binding protein [Piscirickettsiaceae bacterium]|nr:MAG: ABC transporter substrate-binding protein [Piscirickettsiaceae bacterium]